MPDCQQVLPGDGVSAWTRDLSRNQREAQEHKDTQTLYLKLTEPDIILPNPTAKSVHEVYINIWHKNSAVEVKDANH